MLLFFRLLHFLFVLRLAFFSGYVVVLFSLRKNAVEKSKAVCCLVFQPIQSALLLFLNSNDLLRKI